MGSLGKYILLKDTRNPVLRASVGDSLQLWLDASDDSTITESSNLVSQWDDKSRNGNDATQGTGAEQPTFTASGIGTKSTLDYDGTADHMDFDSDITLTADFSVFLVLNSDTTTDTRMALADNTTSNKIGVINPNKLFVRVVDAGSSDTTQTFPAGNSILYLTRNSSNKVDQAFNGGSLNRLFSDVAQSGTTTYGRVGTDDAAFFWNGDIAEIIIYNQALTSIERTDIERYLATKWNISISAPDNIGGLQLWLDANDNSTITESSSKVSQWDDKSGNGNDVTQATGSRQPTANSRTISSKRVLDFDGGNSLKSVPISFPAQPTTIFVVAQDDVQGGGFIFDGNALTTAITMFQATAPDRFRAFAGTVLDFNSALSSAPTIRTFIANGVNSEQFIDGASVVTGDAGTQTLGGITIGSRFDNTSSWDGAIAEVLVYAGLLSTAELTAVHVYLSNKWGITLT